MTRHRIGRHDLERLALKEIRSLVGGDFVSSVKIEIESLSMRWSIHAFGRKGGDIQAIQYAISETADRLRKQYDLNREVLSGAGEDSRPPLATKD